MMFPFEFIVYGPPVSQQARSRQRLQEWKTIVREAAAVGWQGAPPTPHHVIIAVTYFYEVTSLDVDNIVKPIQDALNGLVYVDDSQ